MSFNDLSLIRSFLFSLVLLALRRSIALLLLPLLQGLHFCLVALLHEHAFGGVMHLLLLAFMLSLQRGPLLSVASVNLGALLRMTGGQIGGRGH
jgi:hypothetical protein